MQMISRRSDAVRAARSATAALFVVALPLLGVAACAAPVEGDEEANVGQVESAVMKPPPEPCTATSGCGATGPVQVGYRDTCFGAVGSNCDGAFVPFDDTLSEVGCDAAGRCWINAGSWLHDQCCFRNRDGYFCDGIFSTGATTCRAEMNTAIHRAQHNLGWRRTVSMTRDDNDGIVDFAEYCAPAGTIVASQDVIRCCSGRGRGFDPSNDAPGNVVMDGSFTPMVCLAGPLAVPPAPTTPPPSSPPPPSAFRTCVSQADCGTSEVCITYGTGKRCLPRDLAM